MRFWSLIIFKGAVGLDLILMDDNASPHRAHLDDFLESIDVWMYVKMYVKMPDVLASEISQPEPCRAYLGRSVGSNWNSQPLSPKHPGHENSVAERVAPIITGTHKRNSVKKLGREDCIYVRGDHTSYKPTFCLIL